MVGQSSISAGSEGNYAQTTKDGVENEKDPKIMSEIRHRYYCKRTFSEIRDAIYDRLSHKADTIYGLQVALKLKRVTVLSHIDFLLASGAISKREITYRDKRVTIYDVVKK